MVAPMARRTSKPVAVLLATSLMVLGSFGVASAASHARVSIASPAAPARLALPAGHSSPLRVAVAATQRRLDRGAIAAAGKRSSPRTRINAVLVLAPIAGGSTPAASARAAGPRAPPSLD
jgi:hypothetical protein